MYIKDVAAPSEVQYAGEVRTKECLANTRKKALTELAICWGTTIDLETAISRTRLTTDFQRRIIVLTKQQSLQGL